MKMKQTMLFVFILILISPQCDTTEPPVNILQPGRRDYVWTVDTLKPAEGRSLPSRMWGANANDVWAVGLSYLNSYCIWHFDGNRWTNYVPDQYIDPRGIWGKSSNNIWIGSTDGAFWHFDGFQWSKFQETVIPDHRQFVVQWMCGNRANNIYAVGFADSIAGNSYKAIIMHYNGVKWDLVNIPTIQQSFKQIYYDENSGNFIIAAWEFDTPNEYIYSFDGTSLIQIYSTTEGIYLSNIGKDVIAIVNHSILYKIQQDKIELFKNFSSTIFSGFAAGRNEKDVLTSNQDGIGHYNGIDLKTIYPKWNIELNRIGSIIFENDFYYIWEDSYKTFIVHGKLNN